MHIRRCMMGRCMYDEIVGLGVHTLHFRILWRIAIANLMELSSILNCITPTFRSPNSLKTAVLGRSGIDCRVIHSWYRKSLRGMAFKHAEPKWLGTFRRMATKVG